MLISLGGVQVLLIKKRAPDGAEEVIMENSLSQSKIALAENLQKLLEARNENWATVIQNIGLRRTTLYNWTYGAVPQSLRSLVKLSDYFGVSLDELCLSQEERSIEPDSVTISFELKNLVIKNNS